MTNGFSQRYNEALTAAETITKRGRDAALDEYGRNIVYGDTLMFEGDILSLEFSRNPNSKRAKNSWKSSWTYKRIKTRRKKSRTT